MGLRERGAALLVATLVLALLLAAFMAVELRTLDAVAERDRATERSLALAREALVAYATDRPINAMVGPGYLPCPDLDGDGWAEATCGSQNGDSGQAQRLGRLPWKTLGVPDLRDGHGERLWYAVSSKYKGLLNCGVSRACLDMTPPVALGTITVRDGSGHAIHDGRIADPTRADAGGAAAVVIAPGPALRRLDASGEPRDEQRRECAPGDCDGDGRCLTDPPQRAAACNPANYLDRAPSASGGEDNADFVDRNDAPGRAANGNGFIAGPVALADGRIAVNDRLIAIAYRDVMPSIMRRVAVEVVHCLRFYASRPQARGRYPWPAPTCAEGGAFGTAGDETGRQLGSVPDTPFSRSVQASGNALLPRWWRTTALVPENLAELPTASDACRIAVAPDDAGPLRQALPGTPSDEALTAGFAGNAWWTAWQPFVFYALAGAFSPSAAASGCSSGGCVEVVDPAGRSLARERQIAVVVANRCGAAPACAGSGCERVVLAAAPRGSSVNALATYP